MKQILPDTPMPEASLTDADGSAAHQAIPATDFIQTLTTSIQQVRIVDQAELESILDSRIDLMTPSPSWRGVTASAWIVNKGITKVLLVQREPNQAWFAPGGQIKDGETAHAAALRHAGEQVGIKIKPASEQSPHHIFDLHVGREPLHTGALGADVRYLVFGQEELPITKVEGIHDAQWADIIDLMGLEPPYLMGTANKTYWFGEEARLTQALRAL